RSLPLGTYGSPVLQAMVGLGTPTASADRRINRDLTREAAAAHQQAELERCFELGGLPQAIVRAVIPVRLPESRVDLERHHVTATQLAVDCEIEEGKVANTTLDLKPCTD